MLNRQPPSDRPFDEEDDYYALRHKGLLKIKRTRCVNCGVRYNVVEGHACEEQPEGLRDDCP